MNRQQFQVELSQYLTFVSPEQRENIVTYYGNLIESVGPEGETELYKQIGTPMTVAIGVKRHLEANEPLLPEDADKLVPPPTMVKFQQAVPVEPAGNIPLQVAQPVETAVPEAPAPVEAAPVEPATATQEPVEAAAEAPEVSAPAQAEPEPPAHSEPIAEASAPEVPIVEAAPVEPAAEPSPVQAPAEPVVPQYIKPKMTFGRFLGAVGIAIVSICIVAFFCTVTAIGGVVLYSGVEVFISGLGSLNYLTDSLLTLACGAALFSVGLLVAWFGIWAAIRLIVDMVRSFNKLPALSKGPMSSIWKIVRIIFIVLIVAAIVCFGVSLCLGGDPSILGENSAVAKFIVRLSPSTYISYFQNTSIFG